ncbi:translation machinery-associated protein 16, partial [Fennellomyces sp. T-0311]
PNNKRHTLKNIKNRDELHPYSRKARQLTRVALRSHKLANKRPATNPKGIQGLFQPQCCSNSINIVERWLWFRYALDESLLCATKAQVYELIDMYLKRHDEELEALDQQRKKGGHRTKVPRHDLLTALKTSEESEYKSGFELPDLMVEKNVRMLREWDGDVNGMPRIRQTVYRKSDAPTLPANDMDTT